MKISLLTALLTVTLISSVCQAVTHTLSGPMDPLQAGTNGGFGGGDGNGVGTISGDYDATTNTLNYTLTWMDLTTPVSNMHFHLGEPGVSGGVEVGVPGPWSSPQVGADIVIEDTEEANLLAGNWYLNIHTDQFPGGEIRGQVLVAPIPEPASVCLAVVGLGAVALIARRKGRSRRES